MAKFKKGDRVKVKGDPHMKGQKTGTVEIVSSETPYGIRFDGMDMIHKWYVDSEIIAFDEEQKAAREITTKTEQRTLNAPIEVRVAAAGEGRTIVGYAAIFNSETDIGGMFREKIVPGAFSSSIRGDVRALWNHDTNHVLGRTKAGTLRLREDDKGLAVEIDLPDTQTARDLQKSMERGDIDGMSFGFRVTRQEWDDASDPPLRTIREVELHEVSVVTFPAYGDTEIALRSLNAERSEKELKERNAAQARARIAARKAEQEQKIRGIK